MFHVENLVHMLQVSKTDLPIHLKILFITKLYCLHFQLKHTRANNYPQFSVIIT